LTSFDGWHTVFPLDRFDSNTRTRPTNSSSEGYMDTYWLVPTPFFMAAVLVFVVSRRRHDCPECGTVLPFVCSPLKKTRRMWLEGGCFCPRCGCETDAAGRKVEADTPPFSPPGN
jgi:hypothetical protein